LKYFFCHVFILIKFNLQNNDISAISHNLQLQLVGAPITIGIGAAKYLLRIEFTAEHRTSFIEIVIYCKYFYLQNLFTIDNLKIDLVFSELI